ncbi:TPA: rod shape-determining protein [Candidatus Shapirobacteria bacterium]|uniref:Cell shape-determining protein MreB n=1 Tax=Candidatus Shapirobacteria bacterium GW2011_GWE2_38_30 TaxID=1618490 RepID=A0A0G0JR19_9BACT|nr:MAG: Cell shape determining protein, MreB/Mrl family [Candidatus Shapirobacteria bacterium GW2011_GWE2_38_30]HAP37583.1 rod shape-determining protein [Candidatus Shapirobacteria bacterium]HCU55375.1 rod shape-determining protein [Candidatus Shapirobacteria bacterium]
MLSFGKIKSKIYNLTREFYWEFGVDLGSSNIVIYLKERGLVVDEPSLIARQKKKRWTGLSAPKTSLAVPMAFGAKAKEMLNREPKHLEVVAPIKNGIISDLGAAETMVSHYLKIVNEIPSKYPKFLKPKVLAGVPCSITEVQKRAVRSVFLTAGAGEVILVEEAILAAVGAGLPVGSSAGLMVVDIGGGKTEVTLVSLGGVVVGGGIKTGGDDLDLAILNFIKMKYGLLIGTNTAENIKIEVGSLSLKSGEPQKTMIVRGRDLATGLPKTVKVSGGEISEALGLEVSKIVRLVKDILDQTPPELMEDVLKRGIILSGAGASLRGIDRVIEEETKIATRVVEDPALTVAKGLGILIENPEYLGQVRLVLGE